MKKQRTRKQSVHSITPFTMLLNSPASFGSVKRTGKYHSEQTHIEFVNGVRQERRQIVDVNGNKGTKIVIITRNGKTKKSIKPLSAKEIECIRKCEFVPGLFNECDKCIR
jgi:hypothetical protein